MLPLSQVHLRVSASAHFNMERTMLSSNLHYNSSLLVYHCPSNHKGCAIPSVHQAERNTPDFQEDSLLLRPDLLQTTTRIRLRECKYKSYMLKQLVCSEYLYAFFLSHATVTRARHLSVLFSFLSTLLYSRKQHYSRIF